MEKRKDADMTENQSNSITFTAKDGTVYPVNEHTRPWKISLGDNGISFLIMTQNPADGVFDMRALLEGSVEVDEVEYQKVVDYDNRNGVRFPELQASRTTGKGRKDGHLKPPIYKEVNGTLVSSETINDFVSRLAAKPLFDFGVIRCFKRKTEELWNKVGVKRQPPKF